MRSMPESERYLMILGRCFLVLAALALGVAMMLSDDVWKYVTALAIITDLVGQVLAQLEVGDDDDRRP